MMIEDCMVIQILTERAVWWTNVTYVVVSTIDLEHIVVWLHGTRCHESSTNEQIVDIAMDTTLEKREGSWSLKTAWNKHSPKLIM